MMRAMVTTIIGGVCGGAMGALMLHAGYGLKSWELWAAIAIMITYGTMFAMAVR
jgi:tetrahydromethanopterin S-methyltransferase subunit D